MRTLSDEDKPVVLSGNGRFAARALELGIGHAVNSSVSVYLFDYVLYPYAVWKLGLVVGGAAMSLASLVVCLLTMRLYDWSKRDWLGIEAVKQLRDGRADSRMGKLVQSALRQGDVPACVVLSLYTDPFITTACLRRGAFNGMSARDWRIFFASWGIANGSWAVACFGGVELASYVWRSL